MKEGNLIVAGPKMGPHRAMAPKAKALSQAILVQTTEVKTAQAVATVARENPKLGFVWLTILPHWDKLLGFKK